MENDSYGVVHRITSSGKAKGAALFVLTGHFKPMWKFVKIDTHENNVVKVRTAKENGFTYHGRIYVDDGGERLAFQK